MATPTMYDLKVMIRMNLTDNNEVTTDDVKISSKTYGPYFGWIKEKTTRISPIPVVSNKVDIPDELT